MIIMIAAIAKLATQPETVEGAGQHVGDGVKLSTPKSRDLQRLTWTLDLHGGAPGDLSIGFY